MFATNWSASTFPYLMSFSEIYSKVICEECQGLLCTLLRDLAVYDVLIFYQVIIRAYAQKHTIAPMKVQNIIFCWTCNTVFFWLFSCLARIRCQFGSSSSPALRWSWWTPFCCKVSSENVMHLMILLSLVPCQIYTKHATDKEKQSLTASSALNWL